MTGKAIIFLCLLAYLTGTGFITNSSPKPPLKQYKQKYQNSQKELRLQSLENETECQNHEIEVLAIKLSQ